METEKNGVAVSQHYGRADQVTIILSALQAAEKDIAHLTPDDLAPLDQFHTRGKDATLELMRIAGIDAGARVLDVGGGMGGPARVLAAETSCHVTVLDLTEEFCRTGTILTQRTGLQDHVSFQHGNALDMPFPDGSFDVVWTQHSSMNISDKARLYAEIFRVLRPGGRLVFHDIMAGPVQPIHFPVPWARDSSISFLLSPEETHTLLTRTGFQKMTWVDTSASSLAWFEQRIALMQRTPPPSLGLHLLLGPDFGTMFRILLRNIQENRAVVVQAIFMRN